MARITKIVEPKKEERRELVYETIITRKRQKPQIVTRKVILKYPVNEIAELMEMQAREAEFAAPLFQIISGYRSVAQQKVIFDKALIKYRQVVIEEFLEKGMTQEEAEAAATPAVVKSRARLAVALPGSSPHHTGAAIDVDLGFPIEYNKKNIQAMEASPQYKYLRDVLAPKHKLSPYDKEPWHWECDDECIQHYFDVNKKEYDARKRFQQKAGMPLAINENDPQALALFADTTLADVAEFEGAEEKNTNLKIGIVLASILAVGTILYVRRDSQKS